MSIRVTVSLMSHANITITSGHHQTAADTWSIKDFRHVNL